MIKKLSLAIAMALSSGVPMTASAVTIDPDGGGFLPSINVSALDWNVSSGMSISPFATTSATQFYAHAQLSGFNDGNGNQIQGGRLPPFYEWTFVTGFMESLTFADIQANSFNLSFQTVNGGNNFFEIWAGTGATVNSDNLTGKGFSDGTRVLWGRVLPGGLSTFNVTQISPSQPLDQFGGNDYVGQQSVGGVGPGDFDSNPVTPDSYQQTGGTGTLLVEVQGINAAYFPSGVGSVLSLSFTTTQNLAFQQTQPSACFWNGTNYIAGAGQPSSLPAGFLCDPNDPNSGSSTLGTVNGDPGFVTANGQTFPTSRNNVEVQIDANSSFSGVPEPGTLALLGLGLLGLGLVGKRIRK